MCTCTMSYRINFLRLNILKVFQLSEKHITKITSVDEFLRRIFSVIHSNDPVARAVTLRYVYLYASHMHAVHPNISGPTSWHCAVLCIVWIFTDHGGIKKALHLLTWVFAHTCVLKQDFVPKAHANFSFYRVFGSIACIIAERKNVHHR